MNWDDLAASLTRRAATLAQARAELHTRRRWDKARLLWPLFTTRSD